MIIKRSLVIVFAIAIAAPLSLWAAKGALKGEVQGDEAKVVSGIMALDSAIVAVRPASVNEPGRAHFKVQWMPAVTLREKTSLDSQIAISQKVAAFVVAFQGGVPADDVLGGIIAFVEGENWNPEIGQVFYRVENPSAPVEAWVAVRTKDDYGNLSCCEDAGRIGMIAGATFKPEPVTKILPSVKSALEAK